MRHTHLWLAQLATGAIILVLIGLHVVSQHPQGILMIMRWFDAMLHSNSSADSGLSNWAYGTQQNLWVGLYVGIIAFGLFHGFNGLRGRIMEMSHSTRTKRLVTLTIIGTGVAFTAIVLLSCLLAAMA